MTGPSRKQRTPKRCKLVGTKFKTHTEIRSKERDYVSNIIPSTGTRKKPLLLDAKLNLKEEHKNKKTNQRIFGLDEDIA
jgi:hypothetical protein